MAARNVIDLLSPKTWAGGPASVAERLAEADRGASSCPPAASGRWRAAYDRDLVDGYHATMGGKDRASYDPNGFLPALGVPKAPLSSGRRSIDIVRAFGLTRYQPEPEHFPGPKWLSTPVQKLLVSLARVSPRAFDLVDRIATSTIIRHLERSDRSDPHPFGREEDIDKGSRSNLRPDERYFGAVRSEREPWTWGQDVHETSSAGTEGALGTREIARQLGFTDAQADNIGVEDYDVDENETHYRDAAGGPRITKSGTGGDAGDLHWHYNRAGDGEEDTRISAARVHLVRAVRLGQAGYYDAAERELGIGLHGLQDVFAHAQMTPIAHTVLGSFPDYVKWNPTGMLESALATEGYLRLYLELLLGLEEASAPAPRSSPSSSSRSLVEGDGTKAAKDAVERELATLPSELVERLRNDGVRVFVAAPWTSATDAGFGADLDGDGRITPGRWVDKNRDGVRQWFEVEDGRRDGGSWRDAPAAYSDSTRRIFISGALAKDPAKLADALAHEVRHAAACVLSRDPEIGPAFDRHLARIFDDARRSGEIGFGEIDANEYFARKG